MAQIEVITQPVKLDLIIAKAEATFGDMVKCVVDLEKREMAIGAELHADEEVVMLARGSKQSNLWGMNLYPGAFGTPDWLEFDSMINIRPSQNNRSRSVEDPKNQEQIRVLVAELVEP
jgi:hypothetical protein